MTLLKKYFLILLLLAFTLPSFAQKREVAITIDDLPFVGESKNFHLNMIIDTLKANSVPATGFIIAKEVTANNLPTLHKFHDAGLGLGNHTVTHANLNRVSADRYINEIAEADRILAPVLTEPKYFRYPYLVMGEGFKKERVLHFLSTKRYQVAPISIDSKDFVFNQLLLSVPEKDRREFLTVLKPCYLEFIWQQTLKAEEHTRYIRKPDQPQILLIHANLLNAYVLPDIINLFKHNGFGFVSLEEALKTNNEAVKLAADDPLPKQVPKMPESFLAWD